MRRPVLNNLTARVGALLSLGVATLLIARSGGPSAVGIYALLRVLPGLFGVVISAGLPGAVTYFVSGPLRGDRRLSPTLLAMTIAGGVGGALLWLAVSPLLGHVFFRGVPPSLVALAAGAVLSKLFVATSKSASQGSDDLPGSNRVIFLEEFMFLPVYGGLLAFGLNRFLAVIAGLILSDVLNSLLAWGRLLRRGFFKESQSPSLAIARSVAVYGMRGQVGGVMTLLNLRLDFTILGALAGPAILGPYAIASKYAELLRLLPLSVFWVSYPRYARLRPAMAAIRARALLPRSGVATALAAVPLGLSATILIPLLYGEAFRSAILPTEILLVGLAAEGVATVITSYLYGIGRPGLNSMATAAGLTMTVVLDVLLIPRFAAVGAAIASSIAYLTTDAALLAFFVVLARDRKQRDPVYPLPNPPHRGEGEVVPQAAAGASQ